jgi:GNAT superfamily N-acetyltransferase
MDVQIRTLREDDAERISAAFAGIGWRKPVAQYLRYLDEQAAASVVVLVAEVGGDFAGYLKVAWRSGYAPFAEDGTPEIQDLNVLPGYRRRGVASRLMDRAEALIAERSAEAGIGVGLHPGYNAAQRMYVLRGYVPDARGVTWRGAQVAEGQTVVMDDDLVLHLTKRLG